VPAVRASVQVPSSKVTAAQDVSGKWKPGRTHAHVGQLIKRTDPKGTLTATPTDHHQWQYGYESSGNRTSVKAPRLTPTDSDAQRPVTTYAYHATTGVLTSSTDPLTRVTTFSDHDANGFPTQVVNAAGETTRFGYDAGGQLHWTQDRHTRPTPRAPTAAHRRARLRAGRERQYQSHPTGAAPI